MNQHPAKFIVKPLIFSAVCAVFVCAVAASAHAQRIGIREAGSRDQQVAALEHEKERKRDPQEIMAEVNEDMGRLKALSNGLATQAAASEQQLNYKDIMDGMVEIKKRSTRLRTDLAVLPPLEKSEKGIDLKAAESGALPPALATLNKLIDSFLHNPIFSDTGAVDQQLAAKARRDLEDIITLSDKLRKNADKLSKASSKT
jgi:hypothetical protein